MILLLAYIQNKTYPSWVRHFPILNCAKEAMIKFNSVTTEFDHDDYYPVFRLFTT